MATGTRHLLHSTRPRSLAWLPTSSIVMVWRLTKEYLTVLTQPNVTYYFSNDFDAKKEKSRVFIAKLYNRNMGLKIGRLPQKLGGLAALSLTPNSDARSARSAVYRINNNRHTESCSTEHVTWITVEVFPPYITQYDLPVRQDLNHSLAWPRTLSHL